LDVLTNLDRRGFFHIQPGLGRMRRIADALGHPERRWPSLHVTGTNGKGSVSATLERVLRTAGYKTGLYTSPHLVSLSERIRIGGQPITTSRFNILGSQLIKLEKQLGLQLTYFEFVTALAFLHFAEEQIDIGIIECGMGGRWDATNIIPRPMVSVITSIGLDHTAWLGPTREAIATEKSGIIKQDGTTVSGVLDEPGRIIERAARRQHNSFYLRSRDFEGIPLTSQWKKPLQSWSYRATGENARVLETPLLGRHQVDNGALSMRVLAVLRAKGFAISDSALLSGFRTVSWPGRLQMVRHRGQPLLILDGAHNPQAIEVVCRTLEDNIFKKRQTSLIFSAFKDKDVKRMAHRIGPLADRIYLCELPGSRRSSLNELADAFSAQQKKIVLCRGGVKEALSRATAETPQSGCMVATGSLMLVGEILKMKKTLND
jgi:dihydrofolate synthase/folylpolyglutamate synthase